MAQFKSKFVSASSNSQNQGVNSSSSMYARVLPGFVAGGTIGGDTRTASVVSSTNAGAFSTGNTSMPNARETKNPKNLESSRERPRERRRPSGWDR